MLVSNALSCGTVPAPTMASGSSVAGSPTTAKTRVRSPPLDDAGPHDVLLGGSLAELRSARVGVGLPLHDRTAWLLNDRDSRWLEGRHKSSATRLSLRSWKESEPATPADCERQVRSWRPQLAEGGAEQIVGRQQLAIPSRYRGEVTAFIVPGADGIARGYVQYFGVKARQCLAVLYVTRARGDGAALVLARRLDAIVRQSVGALSTDSIDTRYRRRVR